MGESFTVQISSNLVKQLADDGEKLKKKVKRPKAKVPQEKIRQKQIYDDLETPKEAASVGLPIQPSLLLPVTPPLSASPEINAIHSAVQESEKVLEKMQRREEVMVEEITRRAKDLDEKEFKLPYQQPPPCMTEKAACLECYKEHVRSP
ncbi:hypothetical protein NMG60_11030346 [Bertholletia excelsa]